MSLKQSLLDRIDRREALVGIVGLGYPLMPSTSSCAPVCGTIWAWTT